MKLVNCLSILFLIPIACYTQGGTWVWMSGSDTVRQLGVYGIKGVPDVNNNPGSLRDGATWIDKDDNLWLFGGLIDTGSNVMPNGRVTIHGAYYPVADMWKYDPMRNTWTWMNGPGTVTRQPVYGVKGVPDPANHPALFWGGDYVRWTDKNYNFWLYNTSGNCLWRYESSTNQWAWIAGDTAVGQNIYPVYGTLRLPGANNHPGSRNGGGGYWVDNDNNLWLYGEPAGLPNFYNDVWCFDINLKQWAWMNGPQGPTAAYCYGELGVEAPGNLPPGRAEFTSWADEEGNFYMFGGLSSTYNFCNDVWKYNVKTNNWVWLAGDSNLTSAGKYKYYCEYYTNAKPTGRYSCMTPASNARCLDFFYLFGGAVFYTSQGFNDLWAFYPATDKWKWLSGSPPAANEVDINGNLIFLNKGQSVYNDLGNYGIKGVPAPSNLMPARSEQFEWVDSKGNFWVYGGVGYDTDVVDIYYKLISFDTIPTRHMSNFYPCCDVQTKNDLWKFIPDTSCVHITCLNPPVSDSTYIDIYIPNAFSPNGDGVNDRFTIFSKNPLSTYAIKIFNRWGELVYESNNLSELNDTSQGWDGAYKGKLQDPGVFTYEIMAKDLSGAPIHKKGGVTLVR